VKTTWKTFLAAVVLAAVVGGCAGLKGPSWFHPGSAPYQQKQAERFDPYPDNQLGPEVVGARPREYEKPVAEPQRARWPIPGVRP
jgi:predicted small lipoprotein YifL